MEITINQADATRYPNFALMKIAAFHKAQGDTVSWLDPDKHYDRAYISKVFTFSPDIQTPIHADQIIRGGTGYGLMEELPPEIECCRPDYSIYPDLDPKRSYGFLTRGCIRHCPWCIVPKKEGNIHPYRDIDEVTDFGRRPHATLMDNNLLASDYGLEQLVKIRDRGYRVDFNQGLDARLVTPEVAELLGTIKWQEVIRFSIDSRPMLFEAERAIELVRRWHPKQRFFLYCLLTDDREDSLFRLNYFRTDKRIRTFAQPYRDFTGTTQPPQWQRDMARWANRMEIYRSCTFEQYRPLKHSEEKSEEKPIIPNP